MINTDKVTGTEFIEYIIKQMMDNKTNCVYIPMPTDDTVEDYFLRIEVVSDVIEQIGPELTSDRPLH